MSGTFQVISEKFWQISGKIRGHVQEISRKLPGNVRRMSTGTLPANFETILDIFPGTFREIAVKFPASQGHVQEMSAWTGGAGGGTIPARRPA